VPLILVGATTVLLAIAASHKDSAADAHRYRDWAAAALDRRDFTTARLCYERALIITPADPAAAFGLARSLDGLGSHEQAQLLIARLAPLNTPNAAGYAPAHVWLAERLLAAVPLTPENIATARAHLDAALKADPANLQARSLELTLRNVTP
jgi:tetratricopeptide (TPR) repeat protein